ncbi:MAG: bacterial transcriptional activator domain-containing protein, partial [Caldilineaceae bacterium]|nr:bacterial transcriptional activator domain-containing protein [Caldilineaceae bacterium]
MTLLGSGQIHLGAAPLTQLSLAKAQALLFYLAVTGRPAARGEMTELLWGELAPDDARRNLRVALTKLRQAVGGHLHITRTSVAFNKTAPYWLDVNEFIQQAQMGAQPGATLPPQHVSALEAALALYQGEFLQGFGVANAPAFEEWAIVERERLHQIALQSGETLVDHYLATQSYTAGIDLSRRLLTWAPWQETLHRKLMMQLAATGQRGAALQQYESCRRILSEELGVEPEPATAALYEQLRNVTYDSSVSTGSAQPPHQSGTPAAPAPRAGAAAPPGGRGGGRAGAR